MGDPTADARSSMQPWSLHHSNHNNLFEMLCKLLVSQFHVPAVAIHVLCLPNERTHPLSDHAAPFHCISGQCPTYGLPASPAIILTSLLTGVQCCKGRFFLCWLWLSQQLPEFSVGAQIAIRWSGTPESM